MYFLICLPDNRTGALTENMKNRTPNKLELKQVLLEALVIMSVNWDKIAKMTMRKGKNTVAFKTFSGNPVISQDLP